MMCEKQLTIGLCFVFPLTIGLRGCIEPPDDVLPEPPDENAVYVGKDACTACHDNLMDAHLRHGHSQALKSVEGIAPAYPAVDAAVGAPSPPDGFEWSGIAYVMGGYVKAANFVDLAGYTLTDGTVGAHTQYNLAVPPIAAEAEFVAFRPEQVDPLAFEYACFRCHTTAPQSFQENGGLRQENRPGIEGTWFENGVQCEVCHGPGSQHVADPAVSRILVDSGAESCATCHANEEDPLRIAAQDLFLLGNQQYGEVQASPHRDFACTVCHDPHVSALYDRPNAIRNECAVCHTDTNMALHEGNVFEWGDYREEVSCESCHMPYAAKNAASTEIELSFDITVRFGDTRSHVMSINTLAENPLEMFTEDGTEMARDEAGQASVTTCYICQRCHHGLGNAFALTPREGCGLGTGIHSR